MEITIREAGIADYRGLHHKVAPVGECARIYNDLRRGHEHNHPHFEHKRHQEKKKERQSFHKVLDGKVRRKSMEDQGNFDMYC
jgi:hypothetical protein